MLPFWLLIPLAPTAYSAEQGYVSPDSCRKCHETIYTSYRQTGMGRSFSRIELAPILEDWAAHYTHSVSGRIYSVSRRADGFFLGRTLLDGSAALEKQIHYAVGSGNHSRTYLHRKANGKLLELPLSWYSESGGLWAMSPGYDRRDHSDFLRQVPDSCLFCHNGYPTEANGGLAEGIDCQRCHGPGKQHVEKQGAILNPKHLPAERQLEICLQCHLESASRTIPESIRRWERGPFSFRPGEPLVNFTLYFDRDPPGLDESITVNHSAYGLRRSNCFLRSEGRLLCTTCHDPHRAVRGAEAEKHYTAACRTCHATVHPDRTGACSSCHMPKRRADDAVHVVVTDHHIQRKPPPASLEQKAEQHGRYSGAVRLSYPPSIEDTPESRLYLAVAGLANRAKLADGIKRLESAIEAARPRAAEPYVSLAGAYRQAGRRDRAILCYQQALSRDHNNVRALTELSELLLEAGRSHAATELLVQAVQRSPLETALLNALAVARSRESRFVDAEGLLRRSLEIDGDEPLSWLNLGVSLQAQGKDGEAAEAYRKALVLNPDFDRARAYLKQLRRQ